MNRTHTSNFLFNVFHIKVILMRKLRLAPNQALHVTSIIGASLSEPHINGTAVRE